MSRNSNGRPADAPSIQARGIRKRASKPPPPPAESQAKTHWVQVYPLRRTLGHGRGLPEGWIDVKQCKFIREKEGRDFGWKFDWDGLFVTPYGRFFVAIKSIKTEFPHDLEEEYAVFITEREAAGWFPDPESVPEFMRPLIEKFDLTRSPAAAIAAAPSGNGRAAEGSAKTPSGAALPPIGRAAREKIVKFFHENLGPAWKTLDAITRGVKSNSEKYTSIRLRELVKANVLEHQKGDGLWRLK